MHTWSDVAYSFVNGSGSGSDLSPIEFIAMMYAGVAMLYVYARWGR